ncbi:hypothetical protein [Canicola haemoglobinophilus]|uniref:hypothetical protein n=1 Tax=Canicola haemoglobinophilus TaxID=733 RepID=UPI002E2699BE
MSNHKYQRLNTDFFSQYILKYLDGTRTITDLIKLVKEDIKKGILIWEVDGVKMALEDIPNKEIKKTITNVIEDLYQNGFFNHY